MIDSVLSVIAILVSIFALFYGIKQTKLEDRRKRDEAALAYIREAVQQYYASLCRIHAGMSNADFLKVSENLRAASYVLQVTLPECAGAADRATMAALICAENQTDEAIEKQGKAMRELAAQIAEQLKQR